jgi:hypothetical protein
MDRYVVIHVATTCDEHGVYVTKDSAEVIEIGWILLNAKTLEEVGLLDNSTPVDYYALENADSLLLYSYTEKVSSYGRSILL